MKKTAQNDITGDWLQSKPNNEQFEKNFDLIFRKKENDSRRNIKPEIFTISKEKHVHTMVPEYELNKSTGEVQKVENGDTTNTQE
jgi:hypothetical protein